jgi:hypothetical protein
MPLKWALGSDDRTGVDVHVNVHVCGGIYACMMCIQRTCISVRMCTLISVFVLDRHRFMHLKVLLHLDFNTTHSKQ